MNILFGSFMALIGLFLAVSATLRSELLVYRLLVARSRLLWGERVHLFHQIVGVVVVTLGLLWALGVIWR